MARTKISEFSATPASNTDIDSIFIGEGMAPSNVNDAIRELMAQLKDFQTGAVGDSFNGPIGSTTASTGAFTTLTTTGNVGIGTSSPASDARLTLASPTTESYVMFSRTNSGVFDAAVGNNGGSIVFKGGADSSTVAGLTEFMRLDSAGNLGLGVTPSAWATVTPVFQVNRASFYGYGNEARMSANYYYNAGDKYIASDYATSYAQKTGTHQWFTAASGTAGNAITFTQAMTLDASGNLILGTTSSLSGQSGRVDLSLNGSSNSILSFGVGGVRKGYLYCNPDMILTAEAATLSIQTTSSQPITFATNSTERARIDSSGDLLIGTTTSGFSTGTGAFFRNVSSSNTYLGINHNSASTSGADFMAFGYNGTQIGGISQSGTTAVLYNTTSDQRLKENIVDAPEFGSIIDSLKVRSFDWKTDQTHQRAGFVAQELVTVAPEAVHQPEDTEQMMAVDYSKLVPMLVKEVQSLRKRLADAGI